MNTTSSPRVLSVGNCAADHWALEQLLVQRLGAKVDQADSADDACAQLASQPYHLVLVNRVFDRDGDDGVALIRRLKSDAQTRHVPVMLISNYPEYQEQAVEAGALRGFGKSALRAADTVEQVRAALEQQ